VRTTDPDGHRVTYGFEDNLYYDGTLTGNYPEANAGATATLNVVWNRPGTYRTRIMALDQFGAFSWSPPITITISVTAVTATTPTASVRSMITTTLLSKTTTTVTSRTTDPQLTTAADISETYTTWTNLHQQISGSISSTTVVMPTSRAEIISSSTRSAGGPLTLTSTLRTRTITTTSTRYSWYTSYTTLRSSVSARSTYFITDLTSVTTRTSLTTTTDIVYVTSVNTVREIVIVGVRETIFELYTRVRRILVDIIYRVTADVTMVGAAAHYVLIVPVVDVLIIRIAGRYYGPLPPEAAEPTILDTLSENAPLITIVAVSIIAACLFVMKKRGVNLSGIRQRLTKQLRKK
ncbi:hypothetical protein MUP05_08175, partial [Candidatus Bathyarchaeota archaeon]|nr:hypothetical protein [Candidatus Bathyarchaeota archaeon]